MACFRFQSQFEELETVHFKQFFINGSIEETKINIENSVMSMSAQAQEDQTFEEEENKAIFKEKEDFFATQLRNKH